MKRSLRLDNGAFLGRTNESSPVEENEQMQRFLCVGLSLVLISVILTGCASKYPNTLTDDTASQVKIIGLVPEISTPTTLSTRTTNGGGGLLGAAIAVGVEAARAKSLTSQIRAKFDFQAFAEETLRDSFTKAMKEHKGWTLCPSNALDQADAAFLLELKDMGVDRPRAKAAFSLSMIWQPTVTIAATLIAKPPFDVVKTSYNDVEVAEPLKHAILYRSVEEITCLKKGCKLESKAATSFVTISTMGSITLTEDTELIKQAYREAIELAVKRIADSWAKGKATK
jgi:hypothetical protein